MAERPPTILVIEDEESIREIITEMLLDADYQVIDAENGAQGLARARNECPDLIICDVMMPQLDGYGVLTQLRKSFQTALTPFIFLTAKADRPDVRRGMVLGADDYLTKPFTRHELLEAVRVRLEKQILVEKAYTQEVATPVSFAPNSTVDDLALRQALENQEFQLYYQPQISLQTGQIIGAEALIRWTSPERGLISPGEFIPLAEATGLIVPLGDWVLQTACQQAKQWLDLALPPLMISVNLSSVQFTQSHLVDKITRLVEETGIKAQFLGIELTESLLVKDVDATIQRLRDLRCLDIHVSIDDFGTGYASLGYLQHFPFDMLKIDRCFVHNVHHNHTNAAITTAVIQMAHDLGLMVIAEGVETESEQAFLRQQECDAMQGFLLSRPLSVEEFTRFYQSYRPVSLLTP